MMLSTNPSDLALALLAFLSGNDPHPQGEPVPAAIRMIDVNGDGLFDRLQTGADGSMTVALNRGQRQFEAVVQDLPSTPVTDVLVGDLNRDGSEDLYLVSSRGNVALVGDRTGRFVDRTLELGLGDEGVGRTAELVDLDGDGIADVLLHNSTGDVVFWGEETGVFLRGPATPAVSPSLPAAPPSFLLPPAIEPDAAPDLTGQEPRTGPQSATRTLVTRGAGPVGGREASGGGPTIGSVTQIALPTGCAHSVLDASTGSCIPADSNPTLGRLYPLGPDLNIDAAGNVGMGTTLPQAKLHVNGSVRIDPGAGGGALDLTTGGIYQGGTSLLHTTGTQNTALGLLTLTNLTSGSSNTAAGYQALRHNTSGAGNTASGNQALQYNTSGAQNTASGARALRNNTTANFNTASGSGALYSNTTGGSNTASGFQALFRNTSGFANTASGFRALYQNTIGDGNTASGYNTLRNNSIGYGNTASGYAALYANTSGDINTAAGYGALLDNTTGSGNLASGFLALGYNTTGNDNIAIGNFSGLAWTIGDSNIAIGNVGSANESDTIRIGTSQDRTFIAGIRGQTTGVANGINVLIDSNGQLGTVSSSRRFKEDIVDMGEATSRLLELRPVLFRYKQEVAGDDRPLQYGLIAEEVAKTFPDLVVYDEEGKPFTVRYHLLSSMLLNELKRLHEQFEVQETRLAALEERGPCSRRHP